MMMTPINSPSSTLTHHAWQASANGSDFSQVLAGKLQGDTSLMGTREARAHKAAREFVSTAFIMPLLKQMRQSPFKSKFLDGGQGEDAFGPQLDQILSDRIVQRMSTPESVPSSGTATQSMSLVDAVYRNIMRTAQNKAAGTLHTKQTLSQPSVISPGAPTPATPGAPATPQTSEMDLHG